MTEFKRSRSYQKWLHLALVVMALCAFKVNAATYTLPGIPSSSPWNNCSVAGTVITCTGNLIFGNNDTLLVSQETTLNISGDLSFGNNFEVNPGGNAENLHIFVSGNLNPTNNAIINADLTIAGSVNAGNNGALTGNLVISGNLNLGNNSSIEGNVTVSGTLQTGENVTFCSETTQDSCSITATNINFGQNNEIYADGIEAENININGNNTVINSDIEATGTINNNGTINGNVNADGTVNNNGEINGYVNAPEVNGGDDVNGPVCDINDNDGPCGGGGGGIDHFRIIQSGSASACVAESVTIQACTNANCTNLYSDAVSGELEADGQTANNIIAWSIAAGAGQTSVSIFMPFNGNLGSSNQTAILRTRNETEAPGAINQCDVAGTVNSTTSCEVSVSRAGFVVNLADGVAGASETTNTIQAVGVNTSNQCTPLFENVSRNVTLTQSYSNPSSGTQFINVGGTDLSTPQAFNLSFNASGIATLPTMTYPDAGLMSLNASYTGNSTNGDAGTVVVGDGEFISRPASYAFTNLSCENTYTGTDSVGGFEVFCAAGQSFDYQIEARNSLGNLTPNFGNEVTPTTALLTANLVAPTGAGTITGNLSETNATFSNGIASVTSSYSEVGVMSISASTASYLTGSGVASTSNDIGRFIPSYFSHTISTAELAGSMTDVATSVHYLGQPMIFSTAPEAILVPRAEDGQQIFNYFFSPFMRYVAPTDEIADSDLAVNVLDANYATQTASVDTAGTFNTDAVPANSELRVFLENTELLFDKTPELTSPITDTELELNLTFQAAWLTDADNVCVKTAPADSCQNVEFNNILYPEQRYARLRLENLSGPESEPLDILAYVEYYNGTSFVAHNPDDQTILGIADFSVFNVDPAITVSATASPMTESFINGELPSGNFAWINDAPSASGSFEFTYELLALPWLRYDWNNDDTLVDPTAQAGFGQYRGNDRVIYWLERGW
ncbi:MULTISPECIES: polymer-forming cytoskeletal protein [Gammaproteobacteria]|uniref:polymer-forming cytoskeletal protein n=1 Tax=Gammaproteobacteria TaxID=1236 RepID=UPI000DCFD203|nr:MULTISPECIES: polymer-forming cytoskeletal protein [Gammaproteobacteria]RTE86380.1 hypothetical protein DQX04_07405 [Aliidiomarina sp. B3213]TCZ91728.1 hypothetical protein EYQ95_07410 [Lysobacter sp. N42]